MEVLNIKIEKGLFVFKFNFVALILFFGIGIICVFVVQTCMKYFNRKSFSVDEVSLGIGKNNSIKLIMNKKDKEIAYKIWVELITRKIGIEFDEENDVISEVYDSWYKFFGIARELLKEIPVDRIDYSKDLIELTEKILNIGLRSHLTRWQAKYRKWYKDAILEKIGTPQEIQKMYPEYNELVNDIKDTNRIMIEYGETLRRIAFNN